MTTSTITPSKPSELPAEPADPDMAGCRHDMGDYPAEVVYNGDRAAYQHYRCNGCDIILRTETL